MEDVNSTNPTSESSENKKRPTAITVICVLGFIGAAFSIPLLFTDIASQIGSWYPPYLGLTAVIGLICMVGLWYMKKWAAYTYAVFVVINQVVLIKMDVWNMMAFIIPAIVIIISMKHVKSMS